MRKANIRSKLEKALRRSSIDLLWEYLDEQGFVEEVTLHGAPFEDLLDQARRLLSLNDPPVKMLDRTRPDAWSHHWATSVVVAHWARSDADVLAYRQRWLGDGFMAWSDVPAWVKARAAEGPPIRRVTATIPPGVRVVTIDLDQPRGIGVSTDVIKYSGPNDKWVRSETTRPGALEELFRVATTLVKFYPWTDAQATVFVLTDIVPLVSMIRTTTGGVAIKDGLAHDFAQRITLVIDPTTPVDEVASTYTEARRRAGHGRRRRLSAKHASLAVLGIEKPESEPWRETLSRWNAEHPEWRYDHVSNLRRDAVRAQARLAYPDAFHGQTPLREHPTTDGR
jgi:hypothetical protein